MPDHPEQEIGPGADQVPQPQYAVSGAGQRDEVGDDGVHSGEGLLYLRQPCRAEIGQGDLAGAAGEEGDAERVLKRLDRGRQRGLGDEQPFGGPPVVQFFAEDGEVPQLAKRDSRLGVARRTPPAGRRRTNSAVASCSAGDNGGWSDRERQAASMNRLRTSGGGMGQVSYCPPT
ncbi:hypothetical protein MARA_34400 [Mycolicibacterium arabiense]|uniref:Uncharacterized protein n=1 Tax=Mycolicibacterium arabiense TaxID=1286181 RepID=A0A7I7RZB2_9MYCO|nr:hypothetical protein MARA_34400 [Mycolicibacterium arabiense]